jgi:adenylosuccinate lyase
MIKPAGFFFLNLWLPKADSMKLNALTAISPIDGRYRNKVENLSTYFSEYGLIQYRVLVEIEYLILLHEYEISPLKKLDKAHTSSLRKIYENLSLADAEQIKEVEKTTNHDVKAVEYFIKEKLKGTGLENIKEFVHFGLTSQDINNTAIPLLYKDAIEKEMLPALFTIIEKLEEMAVEWKDVPMLARTHGQPASPTRMGKEMMVFTERLKQQVELFKQVPFSAKFGGATGNFNAHHVTYPDVDWPGFGNYFVNNILGLKRSQVTTQIEHYDNFAASFDSLKRINTILTDLCRDVWTYISMDYFKQKITKGEIGSSAMPHKVNPIDFENAEGNFGVANAVFEHLSAKLPISRLQRDLTDSTVLRNIGVPVAHTLIAFNSLLKGLNKLILNKEKINADLENNWNVVAEAIQTILRREGYPNPYEALLNLTRTNEKITRETIAQFIDNLNVSEKIKQELKNISPHNYTGI